MRSEPPTAAPPSTATLLGRDARRWAALLAVALAAGAAGPALASAPRGHGRHPPHHAVHREAAPPAKAAPTGHAAAAEEEAVEVESIDLADANQAAVAPANDAASAAAPAGLSLRQVVAHLHPAVVHLPIAWTLLWALWEALALLWPTTFRPGTTCLAAACALSFLPASLTGLLHLAEVPDAPEVRAPALLHRNLMFAAEGLGLALMAARYRWRAIGVPGRAAGVALVLALSVEVLLVGWAAHLGGRMVHGDDYLPF